MESSTLSYNKELHSKEFDELTNVMLYFDEKTNSKYRLSLFRNINLKLVDFKLENLTKNDVYFLEYDISKIHPENTAFIQQVLVWLRKHLMARIFHFTVNKDSAEIEFKEYDFNLGIELDKTIRLTMIYDLHLSQNNKISELTNQVKKKNNEIDNFRSRIEALEEKLNELVLRVDETRINN